MVCDGSDTGEREVNSVGSEDVYKERTEPVLVSLSDLYSELESISISVSRPSSCPILYHLLTTFIYCLKRTVNNFGLRRLFYSRQDF